MPTTREWLSLAALAGVGYFVYSALTKAGGAAGAAVAGGIAKAWVWATSSSVVPTGNVILPNGQKIPTANLHITWDSDVGVASFVYDGYGYIIPPNPSGGPAYDSNGDYHAQ